MKLLEIAYGLNPIIFLFTIPFFLSFKNNIKNKESNFVLFWILGGIIYLISVIPLSYVNNYYILPLIPPLCIASSIGFQKIRKSELKKIFISLIFIISMAFIWILYSIEYPYYDAGIYLKEKTNISDKIFWTESPAICYYAKRHCIEGTLQNLKNKKEIKYLPIPSTTYNSLTDEYKNYLKTNFILEVKLLGKQNIIDRNFMLKSEREFILIYRRAD